MTSSAPTETDPDPRPSLLVHASRGLYAGAIAGSAVGLLDGLIAEYIRNEVYYREALAMGLDRDDLIVRRRMRQKVEFLTEERLGFWESRGYHHRGDPWAEERLV